MPANCLAGTVNSIYQSTARTYSNHGCELIPVPFSVDTLPVDVSMLSGDGDHSWESEESPDVLWLFGAASVYIYTCREVVRPNEPLFFACSWPLGLCGPQHSRPHGILAAEPATQFHFPTTAPSRAKDKTKVVLLKYIVQSKTLAVMLDHFLTVCNKYRSPERPEGSVSVEADKAGVSLKQLLKNSKKQTSKGRYVFRRGRQRDCPQ